MLFVTQLVYVGRALCAGKATPVPLTDLHISSDWAPGRAPTAHDRGLTWSPGTSGQVQRGCCCWRRGDVPCAAGTDWSFAHFCAKLTHYPAFTLRDSDPEHRKESEERSCTSKGAREALAWGKLRSLLLRQSVF